VTYRLRTLGGLSLSGSASDEAFSGSRRKPLASLALLASAGTKAMTRDKVAAYLWPEGEPEKVRGVLKQTIYTLRQAFGDQEVIQGAGDLKLNPALIQVDLWEFEQAIEAKSPEAAAQLYDGPFLDGFHLSDAPGFEQWLDGQRDRLARRFAAQIELLALGAMGRNQPRAAADWWLKLTEHDPLDVRAVSGLLHACLADGDRPKAIRYAERHMSLLRKELEITPDPEIRRLVEQARARPVS
jgi:DNA-binding SARP family transcriptional activator